MLISLAPLTLAVAAPAPITIVPVLVAAGGLTKPPTTFSVNVTVPLASVSVY